MSISEMFVSKKTEMYIRQLYEKKEAERKIRILGRKKAGTILGLTILSVIISVPFFIADEQVHKQPVTDLYRNGHGKGSRTQALRAVTDEGHEDRITVDVKEIRYSDEEIKDMSDRLDEALWTGILGKNPGPENVMYDLELKDRIEGFPFIITYSTDRPLILAGNGIINTDRLAEEDPYDEGVAVRLCAKIRYGDYSEEKYSYVVVHKRVETEEEAVKNSIVASVEEYGKKTETQSMQKLPVTADGHGVVFYDDSPNRGPVLLFIGTVAAFFIMAAGDRKIKDEAVNRKKQMEYDHPNILNQYMLYHMAGMNPRAIWYEICRRYEETCRDSKKHRRYAYEEMVAARNKMEEGCGELAAYDWFAARCDDIRFRSFISFVKQTVTKGNDSLNDILYEEMDKALRDKNNRVKIQASEAETKLLLPMFMMLAIVLAVVMIPAFIGLKE